MECPSCKNQMSRAINGFGVVIDYCGSCQGMWFDRGEILSYSRKPMELAKIMAEDLLGAKSGDRICPRCRGAMEQGGLIKPELEVDRCRGCGGIWLDSGELSELKSLEQLDRARSTRPGRTILPEIGSVSEPKPAKPLTGDALAELEAKKQEIPTRSEILAQLPIPSLAFRALFTMSFLYGLLYVVVVLASEQLDLPPSFAIGITALVLFIQFLIGPYLMDLQLSWLFNLTWVEPGALPPHLREFVMKVSKAENVNFPMFGIIGDSTPNAFTYGHTPGNARIVITEGLMEKLTPEELESVVAHEIGHAVHWDMALMTLAALVPVVLYQVYRICRKLLKGSKGGGKKDGKLPILAAAVAAYLCYVISEYLVLFLSRTREYHADRFAAEKTQNPNALSAALVKVAYGLASDAAMASSSEEGKEQEGAREATSGRMFAPLGIFDPTSAKALVCATAVISGGGGNVSKERIQDAMQWDLWNPWAWYYELQSTHPLVANRLDQLGRMSFRFGQKPFVRFDRQQPESYWDEFLIDLGILYLPLILGVVLAIAGWGHRHEEALALGGFIVGLGAGSLIQLFFSYGFEFLPYTVASLLKQVKVSGVRAIPARLKGRIIGKGIPGYVLSEDMTFQDQTGYLFVDYAQPLAFMEWIFALSKGSYVGRDVELTGWYKRCPVPYFEVYAINDGRAGILEQSYSYIGRMVMNIVLIGIGIFVIMGN